MNPVPRSATRTKLRARMTRCEAETARLGAEILARVRVYFLSGADVALTKLVLEYREAADRRDAARKDLSDYLQGKKER